jgi:Skp family chaperone for outer membrane proteins
MKSKVILIVNLSLLVILIAVFGSPGVTSIGAAEAQTGSVADVGAGPLKIGVVSIREIFSNSKWVAAYRQDVTLERQQIRGQLENLAKEIEAGEGALKDHLVRGSSDYIAQLKEVIQNKTKLESDREFYSQVLAMKEQRITEDIYKAILEQSGVIARQKGLALVLEKSEPELPTSSPNQLELMMGTHKVLYSEGCVDITKEVTDGVDANVVTK